MYMKNRDEEVRFLKKLWNEEKVICPKCNKSILELLHKKAKKSNCDWKCPECGQIYRTINILMNLDDK